MTPLSTHNSWSTQRMQKFCEGFGLNAPQTYGTKLVDLGLCVCVLLRRLRTTANPDDDDPHDQRIYGWCYFAYAVAQTVIESAPSGFKEGRRAERSKKAMLSYR